MRPSSLEDGQRRKLQFIVVGVIVLITLTSIALILWDSSSPSEKGDIYFSEIKLPDKEIKAGDKTYLYAQVANSGKRDFADMKIRISSPFSGVEISYKLKGGDYRTESDTRSEVDNEYCLIENIPPLWAGKEMGERSKLYAFGIEGSLNIGGKSPTNLEAQMTVPIKAQAIGNGEVMDTQVFDLTIKKG